MSDEEPELTPERRAELMAEGRAAFNRRDFYEAHEAWEAVWDTIDPPERRWVQGMIQCATGLHKLQDGQPDVAQALLGRALEKLVDAPDLLDGVDVATLRRAAGERHAALARDEIPSAAGFPAI